jgi:hypothetical protein
MNIELYEIVRLLDRANVAPDAEFVAAAGINYGQVRAWSLDRQDGAHLVAWGDNGQTEYAIADVDEGSLYDWLIPDDNTLSDVDLMAINANLRGIDAVRVAAGDDPGPVAILETHYFYGPSERTDPVGGWGGTATEFETLADAREWIADAEAETYCTSHNESGRPRYTIVAVN